MLSTKSSVVFYEGSDEKSLVLRNSFWVPFCWFFDMTHASLWKPKSKFRFQRFRFTILFSHGNAVDLGQMTSFFIGLGQRINCNIFSYDYSGYGMSTGKPTEKNLYADIDAAWHALRTRYGISPENIILYGQSIGTVPTVDFSSRYQVGAVILHSPLMSGMRVAFPATQRTWFFDAFPRYSHRFCTTLQMLPSDCSSNILVSTKFPKLRHRYWSFTELKMK